MNKQKVCTHILKSKDQDKVRNKIYLVPAIYTIIGLAILSTEDSEVIPWGMLFLGLGIGQIIIFVQGAKTWEILKQFIDWSKVEAVAKGQSPPPLPQDSKGRNATPK